MNNGLLITGDNTHAFIFIDAAPFEIVCNATLQLTIEIEQIGATTPESGVTTEVRPRMESVFLELSGGTTSTNDGNVSIFYLQQNRRLLHDILVVFTDNNGQERTWRQDFSIKTITHIANAGEPAQYNLSMTGTGGYSESELEDPEVIGDNVKSDSYTVASGKIQDSEWIGLSAANIIEVCREGSEQLSIGLPYSFNSLTGEITPDAATTIDGQRMFVIWTY